MALLNWLSNKLKGNEVDLVIDEKEKSLAGLNLKDVLDAHNAWKDRLNNELSGHEKKQLDITEVAQDDICTLGKWLYGPGKKGYSHLAEYESARDAHAKFHLAAAEVVIEHQSGNTEKARKLLTTSFRAASNENQLELVRLFTSARR